MERQAYSLHEITVKGKGSTVKGSGNICYKCGRPGRYVRDCRVKQMTTDMSKEMIGGMATAMKDGRHQTRTMVTLIRHPTTTHSWHYSKHSNCQRYKRAPAASNHLPKWNREKMIYFGHAWACTYRKMIYFAQREQ